MPLAPASKSLQLEIAEAPPGGVAVVRLVGTLDVSSQHEAERFLAGLVAAGHTRLALDCAGLAFVSSAGLRALIGTVKLVKPRGGGLAICSPHPPIRQLIELSGLKALLCLSDTVEAGRTALGS